MTNTGGELEERKESLCQGVEETDYPSEIRLQGFDGHTRCKNDKYTHTHTQIR